MNVNRFFLDTAYVLTLFNPNDIYHKQAKALLPIIHVAQEVWITEAILIEIGNALARSNRSAAIAFINSYYITSNVRVVSGMMHCFIVQQIFIIVKKIKNGD
jgi:predicted nucleic acid-binding protein